MHEAIKENEDRQSRWIQENSSAGHLIQVDLTHSSLQVSNIISQGLSHKLGSSRAQVGLQQPVLQALKEEVEHLRVAAERLRQQQAEALTALQESDARYADQK